METRHSNISHVKVDENEADDCDTKLSKELSQSKSPEMSKCNLILFIILIALLTLFVVLYFADCIHFGSSSSLLSNSPFNIDNNNDTKVCSYDYDNILYGKQDANNSLHLLQQNEEILFTVLDIDGDHVLDFDEFKIYLSISHGINDQFNALDTLFGVDADDDMSRITISEMVNFAICSCNSDISQSPFDGYFCTAFKQLEIELCQLLPTNSSMTECYEISSYYLLYQMVGDNAINNEYMTKQQYVDAKSSDIYRQLNLDEKQDKITFDQFKSLRNNSNDQLLQQEIQLLQQSMNSYHNSNDYISTECSNYEYNNEIKLSEKYSFEEIKYYLELYDNINLNNTRRRLSDCTYSSFEQSRCIFDALMCVFTCGGAVLEPSPFGEIKCIQCAGSYLIECGPIVLACFLDMSPYTGDCSNRMDECMYRLGYNEGFSCQMCIDEAYGTDYQYCQQDCLCNVDEPLCNN